MITFRVQYYLRHHAVLSLDSYLPDFWLLFERACEGFLKVGRWQGLSMDGVGIGQGNRKKSERLNFRYAGSL